MKKEYNYQKTLRVGHFERCPYCGKHNTSTSDCWCELYLCMPVETDVDEKTYLKNYTEDFDEVWHKGDANTAAEKYLEDNYSEFNCPKSDTILVWQPRTNEIIIVEVTAEPVLVFSGEKIDVDEWTEDMS